VAHIIPSDITEVALAGATDPELATLDRLRRDLTGDFVVFHGVHWSREYVGYTVYGEVDFVVVNRSGRVLLIEQKNGPLDETAHGLVKHYTGGPKSVNDQVRRALENVREKFVWVHGRTRPLELDYLIYCPDHRIVGLNAAALDQSRVVDAATRESLSDRIVAILGAGESGHESWRERVLGFFQQSFDVVPDIHAHVLSQERNFTRLGRGLARFLMGLEMTPFRLRVHGTAGCGKTMIAEQLFERAVAEGQRPLLVCFNRPLAEKLRYVVSGRGMVTTWYGLCSRFLTERGHTFDYAQMNQDPQFWDKVADLVIAERVPDEWKFDLLVVDEGQDFEQPWVEILQLFLREAHGVLWLEDADQNLQDKPLVSLDGFVSYRSRVNYRSPESVARFIRRTLPFEFEIANDLPGRGVGVTPYDNAQEQGKLLGKIVDGLLAQHFRYEDIVVLTTRHSVRPGAARSALNASARAGRHTLARFTNEYDLFGNQVLTPGRLKFESVYRFKGQQAPAVILIDVDPAAETLAHDQQVLFSGMTRATVRLELVVNAVNPLNATFLER
jgi:hypothetical protein